MTDHPWTPEHDISARDARTLISHTFPDLAASRIEWFAAGWDNIAWLVDGTWVFRFPRRALAATLLETECAILPALAPHLPLPVPRPEWIGEGGELHPWLFAGYRLIPGSTACRAALSDAERTRCATPLARFLAALHARPGADLVARGLPPDRLDRLRLDVRIARAERGFARAHHQGLPGGARLLERVVADLPESWAPSGDTVVHGDLYARHVLVDDAGAPAGIIDWGDVHLGDRAVDLSLAWGFLPPTAHDAFRSAYGAIDEDTWRVARFRALFSACMEFLYARDVDDRELLREAGVAASFMARSVHR